MRLLADPRIEDNGVRKSCETEASSVLRIRSVSVAVFAFTISRASEARSNAAAVCSTNVSSKARASESIGGASCSLATPITPKVFEPLRRGTKYQGIIGNVLVSEPAGSAWVCAQRAAVIAAASSTSSGGRSEEHTSELQ